MDHAKRARQIDPGLPDSADRNGSLEIQALRLSHPDGSNCLAPRFRRVHGLALAGAIRPGAKDGQRPSPGGDKDGFHCAPNISEVTREHVESFADGAASAGWQPALQQIRQSAARSLASVRTAQHLICRIPHQTTQPHDCSTLCYLRFLRVSKSGYPIVIRFMDSKREIHFARTFLSARSAAPREKCFSLCNRSR